MVGIAAPVVKALYQVARRNAMAKLARARSKGGVIGADNPFIPTELFEKSKTLQGGRIKMADVRALEAFNKARYVLNDLGQPVPEKLMKELGKAVEKVNENLASYYLDTDLEKMSVPATPADKLKETIDRFKETGTEAYRDKQFEKFKTRFYDAMDIKDSAERIENYKELARMTRAQWDLMSPEQQAEIRSMWEEYEVKKLAVKVDLEELEERARPTAITREQYMKARNAKPKSNRKPPKNKGKGKGKRK